jgi:hypothetical protein
MRVRAREILARKSGVGSNQDAWRPEAPFRPFPGAYGRPGFRGRNHNRLAGGVKASLCLLFVYSEGRTVIEIDAPRMVNPPQS